MLRRYTDALSLLDMLHHKRLTLLSPSRWYDQNDSFGLDLYGKRLGKGSVYALCLTEAQETGHHWQLFAGHSHGVCVQFEREGFVEFLDRTAPYLLHGPVRYLNLTEVKALKPIETDVLPFLKRETFQDEKEFRVVAWEQEGLAEDTCTIPMPVNLIKRVTLGPAMPDAVARTFKEVACAEDGCADIPFSLSRLTNNESWRRAVLDGTGAETL